MKTRLNLSAMWYYRPRRCGILLLPLMGTFLLWAACSTPRQANHPNEPGGSVAEAAEKEAPTETKTALEVEESNEMAVRTKSVVAPSAPGAAEGAAAVETGSAGEAQPLPPGAVKGVVPKQPTVKASSVGQSSPGAPKVLPHSDKMPLFLREVEVKEGDSLPVEEAKATLEVTTITHIHSPCPPGARCVWSGIRKEVELVVKGDTLPPEGETLTIPQGQRKNVNRLAITVSNVEPESATLTLAILRQ